MDGSAAVSEDRVERARHVAEQCGEGYGKPATARIAAHHHDRDRLEGCDGGHHLSKQ